jgi:AcrR family transcriptional regulator
MRAWVARYTEIYARYEPVFHALETDDALAAVARDTGEQTIMRIHSRLATTSIPPRRIDPVIRLLLQCLNHTLDVRGILVSVAPDAYPDARIGTALTDVLHRTLFGRVPDVNVHDAAGPAPPPLAFGPEMLAMLEPAGASGDDPAGTPTFDALIASGREVFVQRGYHATRVDDLVTAAGVSHGAFYRHFDNVDQLARILTARAVRAVSAAVTELPDIAELDGPTGRRDAAGLARCRAVRSRAADRVRTTPRLGPAPDGPSPRSAWLRRSRHGRRRDGRAARRLRSSSSTRRRCRRRVAHHRARSPRPLIPPLEHV